MVYDVYAIIYGIRISEELLEALNEELKKRLEGKPIEVLPTDDEELVNFKNKLNELKSQAMYLYELSDVFDNLSRREGLQYPDGTTLMRKDYRALISQYVKKIRSLTKDFAIRMKAKPICINLPDMRIKIKTLWELFRNDTDRELFMEQLESLENDYSECPVTIDQRKRIVLDELGIEMDEAYIGKIVWMSDPEVFSDDPIQFRSDGNTIYPVSFTISDDVVREINAKVEKLKLTFPNVLFPNVGFYWIRGTS